MVRRARKGERRALGQIWRAYHAPVLRYLRSLGVADADDVASDVWESVASSLKRFDGGPDDFRRWLFTIARRRMIDDFRRRGRRLEDPVDHVPEVPRSPDEAPGRAWADAIELLRQLPPQQAEVVVLRVLGGFSVEETAQLTDRSPGAVRVMSHRALRRLRDQIGADQGILTGA